MATPSATAGSRPRLLTHLGAIAQLAALGILGTVGLTVLLVLFTTGLSLLIVAIGLPLLVASVYLAFALSWLEHERVEGLYGFGVPRLVARRSVRTGVGGWLHSVWLQGTDRALWRGISSLAIATTLGLIALPTVAWLTSSAAVVITALRARSGSGGPVLIPAIGIEMAAGWALLIGAAGVIVCAAVLLGISMLHATLSRVVLIPSREALLTERARLADSQRVGAVRAGEVERNRIERDLHDGVQPRLVSVAMTLGLAQQKFDTDPEAAKALLAEAHTSTKSAITELRQLARGIHASVLDDRGLDAALSALAARSPIPVEVDVRLNGRCAPDAEAAVYFCIAESLTNAAKHSRGSRTRVSVRRREDGSLWARIEDDGIGGAQVQPGGGLDGLSNRVHAAGGTLRLDSPKGGPTALEVDVPCGF